MNTFESMIRDALASGQSFEDIAKNFSTVLNQVEKEESPAAKRKKFLEDTRRTFNKSLENDSLCVSDAAALATLVCADEHPEWDVEMLNEFYKIIRDNINQMAKVMAKNPMQMLTNLLGIAEDALDLSATRGKRNGGTADMRRTSPRSTDADKVQAFLNSLK